MAQEIRVPEVSDGVTHGTVVALAVAVGEKVAADQTLLELETDKAVVAIPSPLSGTIIEIKVVEGQKIPIGAVIMLAEPEGAAAAAPSVPRPTAPAPAPAAQPDSTPAPTSAEPSPSATPASAPEPAVDLSTVRAGDRVAPAAPSVRRLARDLGVDIYQVQGTGPGGRIGEQDVRAFVREAMRRITGGGPVPAVTGEFPGLHAQRPLPDFSKWGPVRQEPLTNVRRITADAMSYAWSTIPMVTQYDRADVTDLEDFRARVNERSEPAAKLTTTAILLKVCAAALRTFPRLNCSLDLAHQELITKDYVHIGVAVDTPGGLLVPVVRDVDRKGIQELALELNALAEKTRQRRISPADMEGGTFTISNLGGIGGTGFSPIVYAPQVAILGVARAETVPVWNGAAFAPRLLLPLSLTYDHRVVDGADGARFLRWICAALAEPINLAMKG